MITFTYQIARAAAKDDANRQMRAGGRAVWNEDDYNLACRTLDRLWFVLPDGSINHRSIIDCVPTERH